MDKLTEDVTKACEQHGAFTVRKAALRQQKGESEALKEVGLGVYGADYDKLLIISNIAFDQMSDEEKSDDFKSIDWSKRL